MNIKKGDFTLFDFTFINGLCEDEYDSLIINFKQDISSGIFTKEEVFEVEKIINILEGKLDRV